MKNYDERSMDKVMASPDKDVGSTRGVGGVLARLWRQMLLDRNVSSIMLETLLNEFIVSARMKVPDSRVSRLLNKGNLRRELFKPHMTFKTFIKGLKIFKVVNLKIAIELTYKSGKTTLHQTEVSLSNMNIHEGDDEDQV